MLKASRWCLGALKPMTLLPFSYKTEILFIISIIFHSKVCPSSKPAEHICTALAWGRQNPAPVRSFVNLPKVTLNHFKNPKPCSSG